MQQELNPKEQFKAGPGTQQAQQPTPEALKKYQDDEMTMMEQQLPYMRMREEYNRLTITMYEQGTMLGSLQTVNEQNQLVIPGLLGVELYFKEQQTKQALANYKAGLMDAIEQRKQQEAEQQNTDNQSTTEGTEPAPEAVASAPDAQIE